MKKGLLASSSLVAACIAGALPAMAAERMQAKVGGYMEQWIGYVESDDGVAGTDHSGMDTKSDTEIHFLGSTTLDNGIEFGINVQLEGNTSSDQIDETYLYATGSFGHVTFGAENSAGYRMTVMPREYGVALNSGDELDWVNSGNVPTSGFFRSVLGSVQIEPARADDAETLTYQTPRFGGFRLGASYIPEATAENNTTPDRSGTSFTDGYSLAANYEKEFSGAKVGLSASYGGIQANGANAGSGDPTVYAFGATLDIGGFNIGATYAGADDHENVSQGVSGDAWFLGVSYDTGVWGVALNTFLSEVDGRRTAGVLSGQASHESYALSGRYVLGPGVELAGTLAYTRFESEVAGVEDADGTYFVTGVRLMF